MSYLGVALLGLNLSGSVVMLAAIAIAGGGELIWILAVRFGGSGSGPGSSARSEPRRPALGETSLPAAGRTTRVNPPKMEIVDELSSG